jgi:hypothetical protein
VIYRLGNKLNLARFFTIIGVLLMVFAAGLLADSVENLQQLGWLPVLDAPMWHSASLLAESSAFGDVLHSFFGYSDAPTPASAGDLRWLSGRRGGQLPPRAGQARYTGRSLVRWRSLSAADCHGRPVFDRGPPRLIARGSHGGA